MPVYNVEEYIVEALDSLICQQNEKIDLEIIIIDDGSTDKTIEIIKNYTDKYDYIELIEENNIGPGKARNIGIKKSTGKYIAFLDGDDRLYPNAYKIMLDSILSNNADIVVGNVSRFDSTREFFLSGLHKKIFSNEKQGINILDYHPLLFDTTSWNKLFNTNFLKVNNILFPEGILYEDIPFNMEAHLKSKSTNILNDYVYEWRLRDEGNISITQSRFNIHNMIDRFVAMEKFKQIIDNLKITDVSFIKDKELKELNIDLKLFLDQLADADDTYFSVYSRELNKYIKNMKTDVFYSELLSSNRIRYKLVMDCNKDGLQLFNQNIADYYLLPNKLINGKLLKNIKGSEFQDMLGIDKIDITSDIKLSHKIKKVYWDNNTLFIQGISYFKNIDTSKYVKIEATLDDEFGNQICSIPVRLIKDKSTTQIYGGGKQKYLIKRQNNYDYSGYIISIDINSKEILLEEGVEYFVKLNLQNGVFQDSFYIGNPCKGFVVRPKDKFLEDSIYRISYDKKWRFQIGVSKQEGIIKSINIQKNSIIILGDFNETSEIYFVNYKNGTKIFPLEKKRESNKLEFNLESIVKASFGEDLYLVSSNNGLKKRIQVIDGFLTTKYRWNNYEVFMKRTRNGLLNIFCIDDFTSELINFDLKETENNKVTLSFSIFTEVNYHNMDIEQLNNVKINCYNKSNGMLFDVSPMDIYKQGNGIVSEYKLILDSLDLSKFGKTKWLFEVSCHMKSNNFFNSKLISLNSFKKVSWKILNMSFNLSTNNKNQIILNTRIAQDYFEKGPRRKKLLEDYLYPTFTKLPQNKKLFMFEAYWGKSYSCNPKAIYEYLDRHYPSYKVVWSLNNPYDNIPGKAIKVRRNSWKYYYYLARSKYFINNVNWPNKYIKRSDSIEVQTLHGTFLKTMGLDVKDEVKTVKQLEGFRLRHKRWDYLISPSRFMTKISRRVFEFDKEVLEYGFPRNDILLNNKYNDSYINHLKEKLKIPLDKKIILYAPTYRKKNNFNIELDIDALKKELSDEYVLLVRLHYFVADSAGIEYDNEFIYNVSGYPDVQELLLISDVLITDYSSIMFDYANLNRPMIFFTYDLEYYRDTLRGMYIDFEKEAPGELCKNTNNIISNLKNIDEYKSNYQKKLDSFRNKYNEFENGDASKRVLNKLIGKEEKKNEKK